MHVPDDIKLTIGRGLGRIPSGVFILTATAPDGQPYCAGHSRLAYRPQARARAMRG